jgi:tRNA modification GTPase
MTGQEWIDDTIAAISTPIGEGAIGIVRISGKDAISIARKVIKLTSNKDILDAPSRVIHHGFVIDPQTNEKIDEVMITIMRKPKSYTKEDLVEISCHGGIIPLRKTLEVILSSGARLAQPGEFTKRAFINGRIDLSQAEAVADIIRAKTELSLKASLNQLEGKLSCKINEIKENIKELLMYVEASIDFSEEEIEFLSYQDMMNRCKNIVLQIDDLLSTYHQGKVLKDGLFVTIVGKPNVGKSSLLNALLNEERAIVTKIPGTTRDVIQEYINIKGIPVLLSDTAGIRESSCEIEKIGIEKTKKTIENSDIILFVLDGSDIITEEDISILEEIKNKKVIVVINKSDLPKRINENEIISRMNYNNPIFISALYSRGLNELKDAIYNAYFEKGILTSDSIIITNIRHKKALEDAKNAMINAIKSIENKMSEEFISLELRIAANKIGEIVGEITTEDILSAIFSNFCIGK